MEEDKQKSENVIGKFLNKSQTDAANKISYKWLLLANVMFGTFMAVLDATVVNTGLPKIMASLGIALDKAQWVITAYMLAMAVTLPASGWMGDRFGYKHVEHDAGTPVSNAQKISQNLIFSNLRNQAYIQGIDDDFLLAGIITLIGGIPIFFMRSRKQAK